MNWVDWWNDQRFYEALDYMTEEGGGMELAAVHPVAVIGPVLGPDDPPSLRIIRSMLDGEVPACPPFGTSWVDVRDVADLHLRAMTDPAAAGERWLASAGRSLRIVEVASILRQRLGEHAAHAPTRELPIWLARVLSRFNPGLRSLRPSSDRTSTPPARRPNGYSAGDPAPSKTPSATPARVFSPPDTRRSETVLKRDAPRRGACSPAPSQTRKGLMSV